MFYILYKTIHLESNRFYIGVHQTKDLNDGYLGSGVWIKRVVKKYSPKAFERIILSYHESYDEMMDKEKEVLTSEVLNHELCMNLTYGGKGGWKKLNEEESAFNRRSKGGKQSWLNGFNNLRNMNSETAKKVVKSIKDKNPNHFINLGKSRNNWSKEAKDKWKEKLSNRILGKKHINKNGIMKMVNSNDLKSFLDDGWNLGGLKRNRNKTCN